MNSELQNAGGLKRKGKKGMKKIDFKAVIEKTGNFFKSTGNFVKGISSKTWITIATTAAVATAGTAATVTIIQQGNQGPSGADGTDGKSAYELVVEKGYTGTLDEWLASLVGEVGADGEEGADGKSAYELAVENGYTGSEVEWLDSLIGKDGADGSNGTDGANGKSAYELACENGFNGSLSEWLDSLIGEDGVIVAEMSRFSHCYFEMVICLRKLQENDVKVCSARAFPSDCFYPVEECYKMAFEEGRAFV